MAVGWVAMKMVPPVPSPSTKSAGERLVFDVLSKVDLPGWVAFHSLSVSEHEYKRWGELDFVLLSTEGMFALEVKGGGVAVSDGLWRFTDRFGVEHARSESPFKQAESGLMGLRQRLAEQLSSDQVTSLPVGYGVVFPQTDFGVVSVEWAPETVLDRGRMSSPNAARRWLLKLARHWQEQTHKNAVAQSLVSTIGGLLRPEFDRVPSLRYRVDELIVLMDRLTEEQYRQLDFIEENPRLLCEGGAGTGKTFLATEFARREARRGRRVLFTCWSKVLASFVASRVGDEVTTRDFTSLVAENPPAADVLVVDEAQDLLTLNNLAILDRFVIGGLEKGRWAILLDPNIQSAIHGTMEFDALQLLREYGGVTGRLRWNCRNTEPIVIQTRLLTGADLGNPAPGYGPAVDFAWFTDREGAAALLERELLRLAKEGVPPGEITILAPTAFEESSGALLQQRWQQQITVVDPSNVKSMPLATITFARIEDFKGLENRYILVTDVVDFDETARDLALVYVGMSRARAGLWISMDQSLRSSVTAASASHLEAVAHSGGPM
jgi:Nuclease-related domain/IstB-like ATP binding protein